MSQVYFLSGGTVAVYGLTEDCVVNSGLPITGVWLLGSGFEEGYDAGLNYGDGKAYLFKGGNYVRIDIASAAIETEVRAIADYWTGMDAASGFDGDLDAAVNFGDGTVYFFKGTQYASYSVADDKLTGIGSLTDWALAPDGAFDADLDAVVNYGNGKLYFFKGSQYVRYDIAGAVADSEARTIVDYWTGMGDAGMTTFLDGSWCDADPAGRATGAGAGIATAGSANPAALVGGADIDAYFVATTGANFIDWFNANHANKGAFAPTANRRFQMSTDADTRAHFTAFWDKIPAVFGTPTARLVQFLGLQTIFINELGGSMAPVSEGYNKPGTSPHAGIGYLFDAIPGLKASYNGKPSINAQTCFATQVFLDAHADLAFHDELAHSTDPVWAGTAYPVDRYPSGIIEAGMIAQADFCKFRGRGMIQTTWRVGYLSIIDFVQAYTGTNATVLAYQQKWSGQARDDIAFTSRNEDWDVLFQKSDYVIPAAGIALHAAATGYLAISDDPAVRDATGKGSFREMGLRISGSGTYGDLFSQRCQQLRASLP